MSAHFVPAYDILVRPNATRTKLETQTGTVQPNFLSGIYGGITMAQYRQIEMIPGVEVAAPIAMIGYTLVRDFIPVLYIRDPPARLAGHRLPAARLQHQPVRYIGAVERLVLVEGKRNGGCVCQ